jgi:hypothetical protein
MMQLAARPRRGNALQELLASASSRQITACSFATGISVSRLERFASGGGLEASEQAKIANFMLRGAYMIKTRGGTDGGGSAISFRLEGSRRRGAHR